MTALSINDSAVLWQSPLLSKVPWNNRDIIGPDWKALLDEAWLVDSEELTVEEIRVRVQVHTASITLIFV
jgi:hypothetical protein